MVVLGPRWRESTGSLGEIRCVRCHHLQVVRVYGRWVTHHLKVVAPGDVRPRARFRVRPRSAAPAARRPRRRSPATPATGKGRRAGSGSSTATARRRSIGSGRSAKWTSSEPAGQRDLAGGAAAGDLAAAVAAVGFVVVLLDGKQFHRFGLLRPRLLDPFERDCVGGEQVGVGVQVRPDHRVADGRGDLGLDGQVGGEVEGRHADRFAGGEIHHRVRHHAGRGPRPQSVSDD